MKQEVSASALLGGAIRGRQECGGRKWPRERWGKIQGAALLSRLTIQEEEQPVLLPSGTSLNRLYRNTIVVYKTTHCGGDLSSGSLPSLVFHCQVSPHMESIPCASRLYLLGKPDPTPSGIMGPVSVDGVGTAQRPRVAEPSHLRESEAAHERSDTARQIFYLF